MKTAAADSIMKNTSLYMLYALSSIIGWTHI